MRSDNIFSDDRGRGTPFGVPEAVEKAYRFFGSLSSKPRIRSNACKIKIRILRTPFFFPCVKTEVHAPGFYKCVRKFYFLRDVARSVVSSDKLFGNLTFSTAEAHLSVCLISFSADILFAGADGVPCTSTTNILQHDRCHLCVDSTDQVLINVHALVQIKVFDCLSVKTRDLFL